MQAPLSNKIRMHIMASWQSACVEASKCKGEAPCCADSSLGSASSRATLNNGSSALVDAWIRRCDAGVALLDVVDMLDDDDGDIFDTNPEGR